MSKNFPFIKIKIQNEDFDVSDEIKILHQNNTGAIVNFIGVVRGYDEKNNQIINSMTLEHYPGMTESEIEKIVFESFQRWELTGVTVIHRIGYLKPSDQIVFVFENSSILLIFQNFKIFSISFLISISPGKLVYRFINLAKLIKSTSSGSSFVIRESIIYLSVACKG